MLSPAPLPSPWLPPVGAVLGSPWLLPMVQPHVGLFVGASRILPLVTGITARMDGVLGWGMKPMTQGLARVARLRGLPFWRAEDGFIRSVGLGKGGSLAWSVAIDDLGTAYDARLPSRLERILLEEPAAALEALGAPLAEHLVRARLSKYNTGEDSPARPAGDGRRTIILADQVADDLSIPGALASTLTFRAMAETARREHPKARLVLRVHPDVAAGYRQGALAGMAREYRLEVLAERWSSHAVLDGADEVWVVSSQLGFEALLRGIPVTTFGVPFFAGWGLTADRASAPAALAALARRRAGGPRSLAALAGAALGRYCRYADPIRHEAVDAHHVFERLAALRAKQTGTGRTLIAAGIRAWKHDMVRAHLAADGSAVRFASLAGAPALARATGAAIVVWGKRPPAEEPPAGAGPLLRLEDGFLRSHGLRPVAPFPASLLLDARGIHYDPATPSDLEALLQLGVTDAALLARAEALIAALRAGGVSKYNLGGALPAAFATRSADTPVVLVVGQVPDDAAVRYGAGPAGGNAALLAAVRARHPDAYVVFKEHPDVVAGVRPGALAPADRGLADLYATSGDITAWLAAADAVHVMSSLAGFEALLRGKPVVCWGQPFYAGWGLTADQLPHPRRTRRLSLAELVAVALIRYPRYLDPLTRLPCEAEDIVHVLTRRHEGAADGRLAAWDLAVQLRHWKAAPERWRAELRQRLRG
jgi:capsular polysaccharide export protein